jgi:diamine N-acetyltransferase
MKLKGENIQLRALEPEDLDLLFRWENEEEIAKASTARLPYSRDWLKRYLDHSQEDVWKVGQLRLMIENGAGPIGTVELFDLDAINARGGIGIMIAETNERGKGYAREALELFTSYCFETLGLGQLYCQILESNNRSHELFSGVGFERTGIMRNWVRNGRGFEDAWFYQLLAD